MKTFLRENINNCSFLLQCKWENGFFYNTYLYILKDIMRGTEREDFFICISLNTALSGPPEPKSVLQSLVSICYTFSFVFFIFSGSGMTPPPPPKRKIEGLWCIWIPPLILSLAENQNKTKVEENV